MKQKHILIVLAALLVISSCQKPQFVEPTADRQGITSLTAFFTSGDFVGLEMGRLSIDNANSDANYYSIPIPYFYPEETDRTTTVAMSKARVRAELAKNCSLYPPLTILDLSEENHFTYTNQYGEKKDIIITGNRVKSAKCDLMSFDLYDADDKLVVEGFIDHESGKIYLFTAEHLSSLKAKAVPCAHADIKNKDVIESELNYEEEQTVVVLAHDGKTTKTYKTEKRFPSKIEYGFNLNSIKKLFNFEPVSRFKANGFPAHTDYVYVSMAAINRKLIMCFGAKSEPVLPLVLDGQTGAYVGNIESGQLTADAIAAVTNDDAGNMLLFTHADAGETLGIWYTRSVTEEPVLLHEFENTSTFPLGYHAKCLGDINGDAIIMISHESIPQTEDYAGAQASEVTSVIIKAGSVIEVRTANYSSLGFYWGAGENTPKAVASSTGDDFGTYIAYYYGEGTRSQTLSYINSNGNVSASLPVSKYAVDEVESWKHLNPNCLDTRQFNNGKYMAHFLTHFYPAWEPAPQLHIYDISNPVQFANGMTLMSLDRVDYYQLNNVDPKMWCVMGDVILAPSADGFKLYVYYYDHNAGVLGGYSADCVNIE